MKTPLAQQLHAEKYRQPGETFREAMTRVATTLTSDLEAFHEARDILMDQRFLPGGRVQAAVGAPKTVTPYNCFVSGTIEDSFVAGHGSIMERATEAAQTMRMGGGIGYDFSTLRPRGDLIRSLGSASSGPVSFMEIYDAICRCVASSGHRRGAQMGVLRIDHPDIVQFIHAKQNDDRLTGFNISVGVTDAFMNALITGKSYELWWGGRSYGELEAGAVWEMLMRSTWDWAEPGVVFIDTINRRNNLWYCENIAATNPCGEQPLPPHGACLLGSFNLTKYVHGVEGKRWFDKDQFEDDIAAVVPMMDRVVDEATYPLPAQETEAKCKRRMGLGVTGLANALEAMGHPYGSASFLSFQGKILTTLAEECYQASVRLAVDRGSFPMLNVNDFLREGTFASTLPEWLQDDIRQHGIRNSHLTSIAPTGTISLCADNVSSGIEPVFAHEYTRTLKTPDGEQDVKVQDYGVAEFGHEGKVAKDVTVDEHVEVLLTAATRVDSAVSKTCNVPPDTSWEKFKEIYVTAWKGGAKGCTTFQVGGKRFGVLNTNEDGATACRIDPESGRRECE